LIKLLFNLIFEKMANEQSVYERRGVSPTKAEVHAAIAGMDPGILPKAFCKILPDIAGDSDYCSVMHNDTAGTKPSASYLMYKQTGDLQVFRDIVVDAMVMNTDDVACSGFTQDLLISSTIGRNKFLLDGEVLAALIEGQIEFIQLMYDCGIRIQHAGGETADVPDIVRTLDVGATVSARTRRNQVLQINIKPGMVIVGFASFGQSTYETKPNSGIGANGITNARHGLLNKTYALRQESYSPEMDSSLAYVGTYDLVNTPPELGGLSVGEALLSPTRTYLPILNKIFQEIPIKDLGGLIHNTGGGQTKVSRFLQPGVTAYKTQLFDVPGIFHLIQRTGIEWQEMYQTLNMGHRLEAYVYPEDAQTLIDIAKSYHVDAQIIGYVGTPQSKEVEKVVIASPYGTFTY
jgi:phosphoribosylformylglycinamidine cyclo-ligase